MHFPLVVAGPQSALYSLRRSAVYYEASDLVSHLSIPVYSPALVWEVSVGKLGGKRQERRSDRSPIQSLRRHQHEATLGVGPQHQRPRGRLYHVILGGSVGGHGLSCSCSLYLLALVAHLSLWPSLQVMVDDTCPGAHTEGRACHLGSRKLHTRGAPRRPLRQLGRMAADPSRVRGWGGWFYSIRLAVAGGHGRFLSRPLCAPHSRHWQAPSPAAGS